MKLLSLLTVVCPALAIAVCTSGPNAYSEQEVRGAIVTID